jgi:hypothetical protein
VAVGVARRVATGVTVRLGAAALAAGPGEVVALRLPTAWRAPAETDKAASVDRKDGGSAALLPAANLALEAPRGEFRCWRRMVSRRC